jgi:hypothetical protein
MAYLVTNNVQHGHQIKLQSYVDSAMALPGMYQPKLMKTWNVGNEQVQEKFLVGREHMSSFSLDPVYMGDGNAYVFSLKLVDDQYHQFFVEKT